MRSSLACKFFHIILCSQILTIYRIEDEAALKAKVDEALSVYDDYMHNRQGGAEGGANGAVKEESREENATPA
jgi:hypothetical protein